MGARDVASRLNALASSHRLLLVSVVVGIAALILVAGCHDDAVAPITPPTVREVWLGAYGARFQAGQLLMDLALTGTDVRGELVLRAGKPLETAAADALSYPCWIPRARGPRASAKTIEHPVASNASPPARATAESGVDA